MAGIQGKNFWTDLALEPKRKFKFYVDLAPLSPTSDTSTSLDYWLVKSITKPSFTVGAPPHQILNHTFYYPGKVEWNSVEAVFVDPGGPYDTSNSLLNKLREGGYKYPDESQTHMLTKRALSNDLKIYQFIQHASNNQLDGEAEQQLLEKWTLKNAWIQDIKFGDLAYDAEEMVDVSVTFRYDWAEIQAYPQNVELAVNI